MTQKEFMLNVANALEDTLIDLFCRWQDEKEYEDIKDYMAPLKAIVDKMGVNTVCMRMSKRPFGIIITFPHSTGAVTYSFCVNSRTYTWKRII